MNSGFKFPVVILIKENFKRRFGLLSPAPQVTTMIEAPISRQAKGDTTGKSRFGLQPHEAISKPPVHFLKGCLNAPTESSIDDGPNRSSKKANVHYACSFSNRTLILRILFVLNIATAVVICSAISYHKIRDLELELGRQTYERYDNIIHGHHSWASRD